MASSADSRGRVVMAFTVTAFTVSAFTDLLPFYDRDFLVQVDRALLAVALTRVFRAGWLASRPVFLEALSPSSRNFSSSRSVARKLATVRRKDSSWKRRA